MEGCSIGQERSHGILVRIWEFSTRNNSFILMKIIRQIGELISMSVWNVVLVDWIQGNCSSTSIDLSKQTKHTRTVAFGYHKSSRAEVWQSIRDDADQSAELRRKTWLFVLFITAQPSRYKPADTGALQKHFLGLCTCSARYIFCEMKSSPNSAIRGHFVEITNQAAPMLSLS